MRLSQRHSECCVDSFYLPTCISVGVSGLRRRDLRHDRQRGNARSQMQKFPAGKFHRGPQLREEDYNNSRCRLSNKASRLPMCAEGARDGSYWHKPAVEGRAEHVRSARVFQTSTCSAIARASSTSIPRYLTVLSIFVCPSRSSTALRLPVRR